MESCGLYTLSLQSSHLRTNVCPLHTKTEMDALNWCLESPMGHTKKKKIEMPGYVFSKSRPVPYQLKMWSCELFLYLPSQSQKLPYTDFVTDKYTFSQMS